MNDYQAILYLVYKWTDIVVTAFDPWTLGSPANMLSVGFVTQLLKFATWMRKEGFIAYKAVFKTFKGKAHYNLRWTLINHFLLWSFVEDYLVDEIHDLGWETQEAEA